MNEERSSVLIVKRATNVSFFNKLSITEGRNDSVEFNKCEVNTILWDICIQSRLFKNTVSDTTDRWYRIFQNSDVSVEFDPVFLPMFRATCKQQQRT